MNGPMKVKYHKPLSFIWRILMDKLKCPFSRRRIKWWWWWWWWWWR